MLRKLEQEHIVDSEGHATDRGGFCLRLLLVRLFLNPERHSENEFSR